MKSNEQRAVRPNSSRRSVALLGLALLAALLAMTAACRPKITLFPGGDEPLEESALQGAANEKILILPIQGFISDEPDKGLVSTRPGMVQKVVSRLRKAEKDPDLKAVILTIDSPGGTTTGSDILYHEIMAFKERSGVKVVACMMDVAASGGYYAALAADRIVAHPTTVTGSVGVIFLTPRAYELMDKIGLSVDVVKSGKNKDMGYPTRPSTPEERAIMQSIIDSMANRFWGLVEKRRAPGEAAMEEIRTARIFSADRARELGLVDRVGYLSDALDEVRTLAGLPEDARVVAYRASQQPNDTPYNSPSSNAEASLVNMGVENFIPSLKAGFYYLWLP